VTESQKKKKKEKTKPVIGNVQSLGKKTTNKIESMLMKK
jgi:hypothetical protein